MTLWKRMLLPGLCVSGLLFGHQGGVYGAEQVALKLAYPEGRVARYKNSYYVEYVSDRAEIILRGGGLDVKNVSVRIDGEWKSQETVQTGGSKILATVEKTATRVTLNNKQLTARQFPYTVDWLEGWTFSWGVLPDGRDRNFSAEEKASGPPQTELLIEFSQLWMPEFSPVLSEAAVGKGDTWEGEQTFEVPFKAMQMMGRNARVVSKNEYKVKKIAKKKDRTEVTIQEKRKVRYQGWLNVINLSVLLDGEGKGDGEWVIDATRGLVLSHKVKMVVFRPKVTIAGQKKPVDNVSAELVINFKRKLDKLIAEKGE